MDGRRRQLETSDEFKKREAEKEELTAKRGPSLMQLHQMNPENKNKRIRTGDSSSGGVRRQQYGDGGNGEDGFSFDYESEMGLNKKMTPRELQQFIEDSKTKHASKFVRGLF